MGYVPYVGFVTHHHATMRIHLQFKRLMIKQMICKKKKKKKKNCSSQLPKFMDGCTSAARNYHNKALSVRTLKADFRTVELVHAISIYDA